MPIPLGGGLQLSVHDVLHSVMFFFFISHPVDNLRSGRIIFIPHLAKKICFIPHPASILTLIPPKLCRNLTFYIPGTMFVFGSYPDGI